MNALANGLRAHRIPQDLRERDQWVCWRAEVRNGRTTKIPYRADRRGLASSTDPQTWATFCAALKTYNEGRYDGVGFVLTAEDPFVGVDLDHARDEKGVVASWAREIVSMLRSYTELSPSGNGYHIFVRATLPPGGNRRGGVEMYACGRYLTVTGQQVSGLTNSVEERTDELLAMHAKYVAGPSRQIDPPAPPRHVDLDDRELLVRAIRARNGDRFARLWSGDTSAYGSDHSAADLALCSHLAFWTGRDPHRVDRLFRASGLMREKWDERHYSDGQTYGQRTIIVAISSTRDCFGGVA